MKKDNNKRRKAAIGAVIAAGMTTGALAMCAGNSANAINATRSEMFLTAADKVVIDGQEVTVGDMASADKKRNKPNAGKKKTMYGPRPRMYGPKPPSPTPEQKEKSQDRSDSLMITYYVKDLLILKLHLDVIDYDSIPADARFVEDLGADSLDIVEIIMAVEEKYDIIIPDEKLDELTTVGQLIQFVREEKKSKRKNNNTL